MNRIIAALLLALMLIAPSAIAEPTETVEAMAETETSATAETEDPYAVIESLNARIAELEAENAELTARLAVYEGSTSSEYDPNAEVVTFNGGSVLLGEAVETYNTRAAYYEEYGLSASDYAEDLKDSVLTDLTEDAILRAKAIEYGVYDLTEEEVALAEADAESTLAEYVSYYMMYFYDDSLTEEESTEATKTYLASEGITYDTILQDGLNNIWKNRLYELVTKDVSVDEDKVRAFYDQTVADEKATYTATPEEFEYAYIYGETICYRPEGYRLVECLTLPFTDEEYSQAQSLSGDELDDLYAGVNDRYADLISEAAAGTSLSELAEKYDLSDYYITVPVSASSTLLGDGFADTVMTMALGETSASFTCDLGTRVVTYVSDIQAGEVPYEEISEEISATCLSNAALNLYNSTVDQWIEDANVVKHPELMP